MEDTEEGVLKLFSFVPLVGLLSKEGFLAPVLLMATLELVFNWSREAKLGLKVEDGFIPTGGFEVETPSVVVGALYLAPENMLLPWRPGFSFNCLLSQVII